MVLLQLGRLRYKMTPGDQLLLEMMASLLSNWKRDKLNKLFYSNNAQERLSEMLLGDNIKYQDLSSNAQTHSFESALSGQKHTAYRIKTASETVDNFMEQTGSLNWGHNMHNYWLGLGSYFPFFLVPFPFSLLFTLIDLVVFILILPFELIYYLFVIIFWGVGMVAPDGSGDVTGTGTGTGAGKPGKPTGRIRPTYRPLS